MHVVATAGHVDHGKSTLVRALTGQDPDRLAEEHRRGVSIELGYVWTTLDPVGDVAFVDVPGHEKFIATTLAGLGPAGVVLLVVAADDGWMPQSAEHLAALAALGVRRGVLVVTRADLADPGPALASARAELAGTSLADIPQVAVSARTGQGLDCLRSMLTEVLAHTPTPVKAATRLWVDRRFTVRGSGTVVTGTLESGVVEVGRDLTDGRTRLRVRGVEALRTSRGRVEAPARVALNLGAGVPDDLNRGSAVVGVGEFELTDVIDVSVAQDSRLPAAPLAHLGAAQVTVRTRPLGEHHFRLHLERPLPLHLGDRGLLRDPGSRQLWGFQVVDPAPPALRRRGDAARRATALEGADGSWASEVAMRGTVRRSALIRMGAEPGVQTAGTVVDGDWVLAPIRAQQSSRRLREVLETTDPLAPPPSLSALARKLSLPTPGLVAALVDLPWTVAQGVVVPQRPELPAKAERALRTLNEVWRDRPFVAPDRNLLRAEGIDEQLLGLLHRHGAVLRLGDDDVVLPPGADAAAVRLLAGLEQPFSTSEARQALNTSRRSALGLLNHLDRVGLTVRLPDDRRRVRQ